MGKYAAPGIWTAEKITGAPVPITNTVLLMTRPVKVLYLLFIAWGACILPVTAQQQKGSSEELLHRIKQAIEVQKDYPAALALSKAGVERYPNDIDFHLLLGRAYLLNNDPDKAQHQLDKVIARSPRYKDVYLLSANAQLARNKGYNAIRYLDIGLRQYPNDRSFRIKKMNIYRAINDLTAADLQADTIKRFLYKDPVAMLAYMDYHRDVADANLKAGNSNLSIMHYQKILELIPGDTAARNGVLSARMKSGDAQSSLGNVNMLLQRDPTSYSLMMQKLALLQEAKRYPEALDVLAAVTKQYPADTRSRQLETDLKLEAARYYKSTDPYYQYQDVWAQSPGNREALDNLISIALSRGMYDDALSWINAGLKKNPSDRVLLTKKMSLLQQQGKYAAAAAIAARSTTDRGTYVDLQLLAARDFAGQQQFDSALAAYQKVLTRDPRNGQALNGSVNILSGQKKYKAALALLDEAIAYFPLDESLVLKKAAILQEDEQYDASVEILETLSAKTAVNTRVAPALLEAYLGAGRQMMQLMDYDAAAATYAKILDLYPDNKEALNGSINIELTRGGAGYANALGLADKALVFYPGDKEFLLKKSEALLRLRRYPEAYAITEALQAKYPFNTRIRMAYIEQLMAEATAERQRGDTTAALVTYRKVLAVAPADTTALLGITNIYFAGKNYERSLETSNEALAIYPQQPTFMIKKAAALEALGRYKEATLPLDTIAKLYPDRLHYQDFLAYMRSKTYHNQIGITYLNARLDSVQAANIASLQYMRYGKAGSLALRLNFAGRSIGTGLQMELESYINHNKKWYSFVNVAAANEIVFPKYKANYSLFHSLGKGWEAEIGGRFLNFDSINTISGVASLSKYLGDFWLNGRGYIITVSDKQYFAATLTARQYLNNKTDYFYTVVGYGNSPDDFSRSFQLNNIVSYTTYSIGAGYKRVFNYRNIVSINGAWYNQRLTETRYRNQYDIFLSFYRNF